MAFGKITKQDLIDAGLDPDKLKEFQDKGVTKDDLTSLETKLATTVADLIKSQFTELETKLKTPVNNDKNNQNNNNNSDNNNNNNQVDENTEFMTDPTGFVNKKVGNLHAAAAIEFKKMARDLAYNDGRKNLRGFQNAEIKKEIDAEWEKYTPEALARNNADPVKLLEQVHDMVMGRHLHEIIADKDKADGKFNFVHSGVDGGNANVGNRNSNNNDGNKRTLTPEQQKAAKKFGMTDEEYIKSQDDYAAEIAGLAIGGK